MSIKLPKPSTILFFNIFLFLLFTIFTYIIFFEYIKTTNLANQEIISYKIKEKTNVLLTKVLYKYPLKKEIIYSKYNEALDLYKNNSSLEEIYEKINQDDKRHPYNIYIINKNYEIEDNSKEDIDLYFIKDSIDKQNFTEVSFPTHSKKQKNFISYIYSTLEDKVFFLSYTYKDFTEDIKEIQEDIVTATTTQDLVSFIIYNNYFEDFVFEYTAKDEEPIQELKNHIKENKELLNTLASKSYVSFHKNINNIDFHIAYLFHKHPIYEAETSYYLIFDKDKHFQKIFYLKFLSIFIFLIGTLTIFLIYKLRDKELLLNYKDKFISHSIHEIRTPLAIIKINTQLREKLYGSDKYTKKIEGALNTLENSYEDMAFLQTRGEIYYETTNINIASILENRVQYFKPIANVQNRILELRIYNTFFIEIGKIEIERLIDNNISNAIKYSEIGSKITITLRNNILEFHSIGQKISNSNKIFERYIRENKTSGGHGLGLSIVKDICKKYGFEIEVISKDDSINIFRYKLF